MVFIINKLSPCFPCFKTKKNTPKEDLFFEKIRKIWPTVPDQLKEHADFCEFLYTSRLIFTMVGYKNSLDQQDEETAPSEMRKVIHFSEVDGQPCLWKEGRWVHWDDIKEQLICDPSRKEIVSRDDLQTVWNYYYNPESGESGLCPSSRYNNVRPVYLLTQKEMTALGITRENPCLLQVFTSNNSMIPKLSHVGLRIINQNGYVYSLGFETPNTETPFPQQKITGSYDAVISSLDYDEFSNFKTRRVTTFARSEKQFQSALDKITEYSQRDLRFNRAHQNCATYTTDIMRSAGIEPPSIAAPALSALEEWVNDTIPYVGPTLHGTGWVIKRIFLFGAELPFLGHGVRAIIFLAKKINTLFSALFLILLGAREGSEPKAEENEVDNRNGLTYFDRLYTKWNDLFDDKRCVAHSVKRFVDWQLEEQRDRTLTYGYAGPQFYITKPIEIQTV